MLDTLILTVFITTPSGNIFIPDQQTIHKAYLTQYDSLSECLDNGDELRGIILDDFKSGVAPKGMDRIEIECKLN